VQRIGLLNRNHSLTLHEQRFVGISCMHQRHSCQASGTDWSARCLWATPCTLLWSQLSFRMLAAVALVVALHLAFAIPPGQTAHSSVVRVGQGERFFMMSESSGSWYARIVTARSGQEGRRLLISEVPVGESPVYSHRMSPPTSDTGPSAEVLQRGIIALSVLTGVFIVVLVALIGLACWRWGRQLSVCCCCSWRAGGSTKSCGWHKSTSCNSHKTLASTTPPASQPGAPTTAETQTEGSQDDVCHLNAALGHPTRPAMDGGSSAGHDKTWAKLPSGLSWRLSSSGESLQSVTPSNPVSQDRRPSAGPLPGHPGWDNPLALQAMAFRNIPQHPQSGPEHQLHRAAAGDVAHPCPIATAEAAALRVEHQQPPGQRTAQSSEHHMWPGAARASTGARVGTLDVQSLVPGSSAAPHPADAAPWSSSSPPRGSGTGTQMLPRHLRKLLGGREAVSLDVARRTGSWQHSLALGGEKPAHMLSTYTTGSSSIPRSDLPVMECSLSNVDSAPSEVDRRLWSGSGAQAPMATGGRSLPLLPLHGGHASPLQHGFEPEHVSGGWESPVAARSGPVWMSSSLPQHRSVHPHSFSAMQSPSTFSHGVPFSPRSAVLADSPAYGAALSL
jgi:hypothetical protein